MSEYHPQDHDHHEQPGETPGTPDPLEGTHRHEMSGSPEESEQATHHERESDRSLHPRIWIGSLVDYTNGILHGDWVDAAVDADELREAARAILARSHTPRAEEWAIFDHDDFAGWFPREHEDLDVVARVARGLAEHGPAFGAWAELHDADEDMLASFQDGYLGHYDSAEDLARDVMADMGVEADLDKAIPASLRSYVQIDYAGWARDCFLNGDIYFAEDPEGGVWVFDQQ